MAVLPGSQRGAVSGAVPRADAMQCLPEAAAVAVYQILIYLDMGVDMPSAFRRITIGGEIVDFS